MTVLYIEDDFIDRKNMMWLCSNFPAVKMTIVKDFEKARDFLAQNKVDLILTDRRIGNESFSEYPDLWTHAPYYVVSNTIFKEKNVATAPIQYLQKPLLKSNLDDIFSPKESKVDLPNMSYFEQLPSPDMVKEMVPLLIEELEKGQQQIKQSTDNENKQLSRAVHNLAGKFSLLGMKKTFHLSRKIEEELENGKTVDYLLKDLLESIEASLDFLRKQKP